LLPLLSQLLILLLHLLHKQLLHLTLLHKPLLHLILLQQPLLPLLVWCVLLPARGNYRCCCCCWCRHHGR
jgi:hypothetical protein